MKFVALLALLLAGAIAMGAPGGLASAAAVRASKGEGTSAELLSGDSRRHLAAPGECVGYNLFECCCDGDDSDNDGDDDADCSCACPAACPRANFDDDGDDGDD